MKKTNFFFEIIAVLGFVLLTGISINNGYFWDNIQQTSKEAHWFYQTNFSSLLMPAPDSGSEIVATGYHPPLMGIMTAVLWKIFGYKLWVSHIFMLFWGLVLIYNLGKLLRLFFDEKILGWVLLIVLLEPTILTQFSIASPDFILFTAFIIALRAVLEKKPDLLSIGLIFLCGINMRGIFVGGILLIVQNYLTYIEQSKRLTFRLFFRNFIPFLPVVLLLIGYFLYYLLQRGWFFASETSVDHYALPSNLSRIVKHLAEFGLRSIENGRIFIWLLAFFIGFKMFKSKSILSQNAKVIFLFLLLLTGLYLVFVFISQMPFSDRYFMPQFFLLTILVLSQLNELFSKKKMIAVFIAVLFFELTGNCWIYPDRIAKSWDSTLAHLPYYELRKECFNYIDQQKLNYNDISAGFCLYGDRKFVELNHAGDIVGDKPDRKYFINSNISNNADVEVDDFRKSGNWKLLKTFQNGVVYIEIFERNQSVK
jgi:4-amino-4-deoxy-L-arabinose transferase-like glycosyltransferase